MTVTRGASGAGGGGAEVQPDKHAAKIVANSPYTDVSGNRNMAMPLNIADVEQLRAQTPIVQTRWICEITALWIRQNDEVLAPTAVSVLIPEVD
jgi:hypothetical protein